MKAKVLKNLNFYNFKYNYKFIKKLVKLNRKRNIELGIFIIN